MGKEKLTIDKTNKDLDNNIQNLTKLKSLIEKEMIKIDEAYDKVDKETTKSFEAKRALLNQKEESLKDKLKNEVTKTREKFEINISLINELIKYCEKIQKGIKNLKKEEKNMIKTLSYISKVNKNQREIDKLTNSSMKNMKIAFNEDKCIIEYKEYYFNEKKYNNYDKEEEMINIEEKSENEEKKKEENYYENEKKEDYYEEKKEEDKYEEKKRRKLL